MLNMDFICYQCMYPQCKECKMCRQQCGEFLEIVSTSIPKGFKKVKLEMYIV
jgi:hypothetical protein